MISINPADYKRFWDKVQIVGDNECWLWTGCKGKSGNSMTPKWNPALGFSSQVIRAAWQMTYGEIPEGKRVNHTCGSLLCCNPAHLRIASDMEERFWSKVDKRGEDECWEWQARVNQGGYGSFRADPKKPHIPAHRVAYQLIYGEIGEGLVICHKCDNRKCVNPNHLFHGTTKDNVHDMIKKGRDRFIPPKAAKGEENKNAKLTDEQVREIRIKLSEGMSCSAIGREYGMSNQLINMIKHGKAWKHVD